MLIGGCLYCAKDKPKPRWFLGVIERATGKYSILNINTALFSKLRELIRNPEYGDPQTYDIEITLRDIQLMRDPIDKMYEVTGLPKTPLIVDESERNKIKEKLVKLTDPLFMELEDISTMDDFKNFYISIHHDPLTVELLSNVVPKWYPKFKDVLHKLITFS